MNSLSDIVKNIVNYASCLHVTYIANNIRIIIILFFGRFHLQMNKTSVTTLYLYAFLFTLSAWLCDVTFTTDRSCTLVGCDWTQFTTETVTCFSDIQPPTNIDTANTFLTNIILHTDKQNIPTGKIHATCTFQNTENRTQNSEITSFIQTHKSDIWREHIYTHTGITTHILFGRQYMD